MLIKAGCEGARVSRVPVKKKKIKCKMFPAESLMTAII